MLCCIVLREVKLETKRVIAFACENKIAYFVMYEMVVVLIKKRKRKRKRNDGGVDEEMMMRMVVYGK